MKNFTITTLFSAILVLSSMNIAIAQNYPTDGVLLKGYGLYVFDDGFDARFNFGQYYDGKVKGGLQWGVGVEYRPNAQVGLELMYLRQDTNAPTSYLVGIEPEFTDFDLAMNYIMVGGLRHAQLGAGNVEAFGGLMGGMLIADVTNPETRRSESATKFAWGFKGGLTVWATQRFGVMFQAQLLSVVEGIGGGFYFGTGGPGAGISAYSTMYQFGLGGGVVLKLN
jgi:hypothetical protein